MACGSKVAGLSAALGLLLLIGCAGAPAQPNARAPSQPSGPGDAPVASTAPADAPPAAPPLRLPCGDRDLIGCTNGCSDHQTEDCVTLASMYMTGEVVTIDHERAIGLFRDACDQGSARGCMRLGDVYHAGLLHDDTVEAALYRKACDAGANLGCVTAGKAYLDGRGVARDAEVAALLFTKVCDRGNAAGCYELAQLYERGEGVKKNPTRAFELFLKSCNLGLDQGCLVASRTEEVVPPRN
jgi:uncharacterized protein